MAINFAAANTAGLNNPGTEIITLVKDGSGNFINPPSFDKMREYLRSGEVPMLFVTDEAGETGSLYQLVEYSETENKIRFGNDKTTIEFSAGSAAPVVSDVGGGSGGGGLFKVTITGTADETGASYTYVSDKTGEEVYNAYMNGLLPYAELIVGGDVYFGFVPCMGASNQRLTQFIAVTANQSTNNEGKILVSNFMLQARTNNVNYSAYVLNGVAEKNCKPFSTLYD